MASNDRFRIIGYEITGEPDLADHKQHYGPEITKLLQQTHPKVYKAKRKFLPELLELVEKYSHVPAFKNYLSTYYQRCNQPEKAYTVNRQLVKEHPEYLHGKVNLAAEYLFKEEYEKVPQILGELLDPKALYPHRKVFHINEIEVFMNVVCRYLIAVDRLEEAEDRIDLLEEIDAKPKIIEDLRMMITVQRLANMTEHFQQKEAHQKVLPIGRGYDKSIQTEEAPQLHHPELQVLYEHGLGVQAEVLKQLLALPRETLVEDLKLILWDSVRRYEFFEQEIEKKGWDEDRHHFPIHALFLLTELRAVDEALPLLLECLRQGDDYQELWYGDHRFETWWHFIYHLGGGELEQLKAFMLESDLHYSAKNIVSEAVKQIGLHQPKRREEVLDWYEAIFHYFLDHQEEELLIDMEVISAMIGDLYSLRGKRLLPLIRKFYDLDLVDTFRVGHYDALEKYLQTATPYGNLMPVFGNIFQHYQHIVTSWHGYVTEEEKEAKEVAWSKKLAELDAQKDWDYTAQHSSITTSKRTSPKVGRNAPCPCGSGKKHKRCCWGK